MYGVRIAHHEVLKTDGAEFTGTCTVFSNFVTERILCQQSQVMAAYVAAIFAAQPPLRRRGSSAVTVNPFAVHSM